MTPERWQQIDGLLEAALERAPSERAAFLDEACAGDEVLRRKVELLLESDQRARSFIESPAVQVAATLFAGDKGDSIGPERPVGPYRVMGLLGKGGMGDVYLAEDSRLGRRVALKLLPKYLTQDQDRLRRFKQEARAASALNHTNVATIYEIGEAEGMTYIAMEYVEGQTLEAKIKDGALDSREVVEIGIQVARALQEAHSKGIIHRDIKPGNIMLTPRGQVKVLDFGLAKMIRDEDSSPGGDSSIQARTQSGMVMGTVGYMSPEQVRGQATDHRSDIFSFGVIFYEMLSAERPFRGESSAEVMNAILKEEPAELQGTNRTIPPALERVMRHCLEKNPEDRWQSMSDVAFDLEGLSGSRSFTSAPPKVLSGRAKNRERLGWIVAAVAVLAVLATLGVAYFRRAPVEVRAVRSFILPPEKWALIGPAGEGGPVISPDGTRLAFVATTAGSKSLLWVRSLEALSPQAIEGTEGAHSPFWSPDGRFIGFFADNKLKKIATSGGPQITLCDVQRQSRGGTWNRDGVIIFAPGPFSVLYRVSASGGVATPVTKLDQARGENGQLWPYFLPDGQHFLYLGRRSAMVESDKDAIYVGSLGSEESKPLLHASCNAAYAQGHLLFLRQATLMAQPFDTKRLETLGDPSPVAEQIWYSPNGSGFFSVCENGFLAYQRDPVSATQLTWIDRAGKLLGVIGDQVTQSDPRISPDGKTAMVTILDPKSMNRDIWVYDLARGLRTRFTFDPADERMPVWSPDGSHIVFHSNRKGHWDLYEKTSTGVGSEELLLESDLFKVPFSWSPDGRFLLFRSFDPKTNWDLWILPLSSDRESKIRPGEPFPFSRTEFNEMGGEFSPDGRWIAFESGESGKGEVYVAPFAATGGGKRQVSLSGGSWPKWRGDGREIFYLNNSKLMAAEVNIKGATFEVGAVRALLDTRPFNPDYSYAYDVTPDGQRFLVNAEVEPNKPSPITLVINWTADLKR